MLLSFVDHKGDSAVNFYHILLCIGDGSCFHWSAELLSQTREEISSWELIGPDCDPVYSICRSANAVYTACRDAKIRKYILNQPELPS